MGTPWPLIGRAEELAFGADALGGAGLVISGGSGVGKTRLAAELLRRARADGLATERILCTRATADIPLGALAPLLPVGDSPVDPLGGSRPLQLLNLLRASVRERSDNGRVVISIDDAHLLDDIGAAAILQLVTAGDATVIATVRTGEPTADAVRSLWRDAGCIRLELQALSGQEVLELMEQVAGGPVAERSAERISSLTGGNPLFVREVLAEAVDHGTLVLDHGVWTWTGTIAADAPLRELVTDRLGRLDDGARATIALVAAGEPMPLSLVEKATDPQTLANLEGSGLLGIVRTSDGGTSVQLGHPLYGEVLRTSDPLTAAAHRRLVSLVGDDPPPHLRLSAAVWALRAGVDVPAEMFLAACEQARSRGDEDLASRLAQAAVAAGGGDEAAVALGRALVDADRPEAELVLLPLLDASDDRVRAIAVTALADLRRYILLQPAEALATFDGIRPLSEPWHGYVEAHRATILAYSGRLADAGVIARPLLDADDAQVRVRALVPAGLALGLGGYAETMNERVDALLADAFAIGDAEPQARGWWLASKMLAQLVLADHDGLEELANGVVTHPDYDHGGVLAAHLAVLEGRDLLYRGMPASAAARLRDAVSHRQPGGEEARRWTAALLAEALALVGDLNGSAGAWEQADVDNANEAAFLPDMVRAGAWVRWAQGQSLDAHKEVQRAIDIAASSGVAVTEMCALQDAARLGSPLTPLLARMEELAEWMEGPVPPVVVAHLRALHSGDPAGLLAAGHGLADLGLWLTAAECAATAGDPALARQWAERCQGAMTPMLAGRSTTALTSRELEVARIAAGGVSSRDIAERLHISARTVDNHLSRVYAKLGVTSRADLSNALAQNE